MALDTDMTDVYVAEIASVLGIVPDANQEISVANLLRAHAEIACSAPRRVVRHAVSELEWQQKVYAAHGSPGPVSRWVSRRLPGAVLFRIARSFGGVSSAFAMEALRRVERGTP